MKLPERIALMARLGDYIKADSEAWKDAKEKAFQSNGWFIPTFIQTAAQQIADNFLQKEKLESWTAHYHIDDSIVPKNVGVIMAGNIPLVGFHDMLAVFISGHHQNIKLSSKDDVLLKHFVKVMYTWNIEIQNHISFAEMLKDCDAYIATGSNNSARTFDEYFGKYPNIIRRNRTSAAILSGKETAKELAALSEDIHLYFGLGCRNVTKLFVPENYDFVPLLNSFNKYAFFGDHHKYKNNFDYQLSILLLNNIYYMTNSTTLVTENKGTFSPISQVWFERYENKEALIDRLKSNEDIQCIVGDSELAFGEAQCPRLFNYADGVDTMQFLLGL